MLTETDFTLGQLKLLRAVYLELQTAESQAILVQADEADRLTELVAEFGERFPYVKPKKNYTLSVEFHISVTARSEEEAEAVAEDMDYNFDHHDIDDSEIYNYSASEAP